MYADCISEIGSALQICLGFMDGTKVSMTRPGGLNVIQNSCYSGHMSRPCLVYISVTTLDGLFLYLYGSEVGCHQNMTLHRQTALHEALEQNSLIERDYSISIGTRLL